MADIRKLSTEQQVWAEAAGKAYGNSQTQKLTAQHIKDEMALMVELSGDIENRLWQITTAYAKTDPDYQLGAALVVRKIATAEIKDALDIRDVKGKIDYYAGFLQIAENAKTNGPTELSKSFGVQKRADALEKVDEFLANLRLMQTELQAAQERDPDPKLREDFAKALGFLEKNWIPKVTALQESLKTDVTKIVFKGRSV